MPPVGTPLDAAGTVSVAAPVRVAAGDEADEEAPPVGAVVAVAWRLARSCAGWTTLLSWADARVLASVARTTNFIADGEWRQRGEQTARAVERGEVRGRRHLGV